MAQHKQEISPDSNEAGINFDNPTPGHYWLQTWNKNTTTGEVIWNTPEVVQVVFTTYGRSKKEVWRIRAFFWQGTLERYRDSGCRWQYIPPPKFKGEERRIP